MNQRRGVSIKPRAIHDLVAVHPSPTSTTGHVWQIFRTGGQNWEFRYDNVVLHPYVIWPTAAKRVQAGLESSNANNVVPAHWFSDLKYTISQSPWYPWYQDVRGVTGGLCGRWDIQYTRWSAAQNAPC